MKIRNTTKLITKTMAVAALTAAGLLCGAGWLQPVQAESDDGSVRFVSYASIGIVRGQKVRLIVSNTKESAGTASLSFSYYLAQGSNSSISVPFYETEWIQVPRGEMRSSEIRREDLKTEGEPVTERAQMIVRVTILAAAGSKQEDFTGALEVIADEVPGEESVQTDTKYRLVILAAQRSKHFAPISLKRGERLSYTFINPNEEGSQPVRVRAHGGQEYLEDGFFSDGDPIDWVELRPGESYTANINYDDLRVAGEGDEVWLSVLVTVELLDGSVRPVNLHVSMERVDRTGRTTGGDGGTYFTGTVTVSGDGFYDPNEL